MPVRKIPIGTRSVTGQHAKSGARYESSLERDFYELMTLDPMVDHIEEQPVCIEYRDESGKRRRYTPDALVTFKSSSKSITVRPPLLCEVKYREDFKAQFTELRRKFRAACVYSKERGWRFKVFTDETIRTTTFANMHFLAGYRDRSPIEVDMNLLLECLSQVKSTTPAALLAMITNDDWKKAGLIPVLWWLIANFRVHTDLTVPLTMHSTITHSACP